ncbi:MAG: c-type cytochrome [Acidiferrobacter sp.]
MVTTHRIWGGAVAALLMATAVSALANNAPSALALAVKTGAHIFTTDSFGGHEQSFRGRHTTCATCHINGGRTMGRLPNGKRIPSLTNAVAIFPRYNPHMRRVITLETQIRACVQNGLLGHPPAYGSTTMVDLVSYLGALAHGQPVAIGGPPR